MKQDLLAKGFSLLTLLMVQYSPGHLLFISVDLVLNWFSTRVSDNWRYVFGRTLYVFIITQKFKGLDLREITSLQEIKNEMRTWHVMSIIAENKPHAHHKTHLNTLSLQHPTS